jgi:ATP-dependent DNA helicase RecG
MEEAASLGIAQGKGLDKPQKDMRSSPHLLSITATPIPRTLALTIFGDLDISTIGELPAGRQPVTTIVLPPERESLAFDTIRREVRAGHQAFIICPLVSTSEKIEAKAATEEFERLRRDVFPDLSIGLVHGQLKSREKEHTMREFARGRIDILVATPVIEVGIDIPNATVIVIEGAERFGLAQLYQFRGRVGRSTFPSFCFLVGGSKSATAKRRLAVIAKATSGKEIAAADLTLRGPGELLGERQSGIPDTFMRAIENLDLIERAREAARAFLTKGGLHSDPLLRRRIAAIRSQLHLS